MKTILPVLLACFLLIACGGEQPQTPDYEASEELDTNADAVREEDGAESDTNIGDETSEAFDSLEDFCIPGSTYTYADESATSDSVVIGLTQYKGSEWCQAESVTVIESPMGDITAETTYYFDTTYEEFWVITTTSGSMPTQTTEIHIVDGEIV